MLRPTPSSTPPTATQRSSTPPKQPSPTTEKVEKPEIAPPSPPSKFQCMKCDLKGEEIFEEKATLMKHLVSLTCFVN